MSVKTSLQLINPNELVAKHKKIAGNVENFKEDAQERLKKQHNFMLVFKDEEKNSPFPLIVIDGRVNTISMWYFDASNVAARDARHEQIQTCLESGVLIEINPAAKRGAPEVYSKLLQTTPAGNYAYIYYTQNPQRSSIDQHVLKFYNPAGLETALRQLSKDGFLPTKVNSIASCGALYAEQIKAFLGGAVSNDEKLEALAALGDRASYESVYSTSTVSGASESQQQPVQVGSSANPVPNLSLK